MKAKNDIPNIIIQAGGLGSRMGRLTANKPKALVSVGGLPLTLRLMNCYPKSHFYIIADYKVDILVKYLDKFAKNFTYTLIKANGTGTSSGIAEALRHIPSKQPVAVIWCDLFVTKTFHPEIINPEVNYIGLSSTFKCRWSFDGKKLLEEPSNTKGVAGVYVFKDREEINDLGEDGEFCQYLQNKDISFKGYSLKDVSEVGTLEDYEKLAQELPQTRPFNKLIITNKEVVKVPLDTQGEDLAGLEKGWYKASKIYEWEFLPTVLNLNPLTLQKIDGDSFYKYSFTAVKKKDLLRRLITNLSTIHKSSHSMPEGINQYLNDHKAILQKTKERLDTVSDIIPHMNNKYININGRVCWNVYSDWNSFEKLFKDYLGKSEYCLIHGDPTLSNTMYEPLTNKLYLIDPRGYFGDVKLFGDPDYDWAKLYYSLVGNYDQFNSKNFELVISEDKVNLSIGSNNWEECEEEFFSIIKCNKQKIKLFHAILWLSLTTYTWDDYDSMCGAFYNGLLLINDMGIKT